MTKFNSNWKYIGLVKLDLIHLKCPLQQLIHCMPDEDKRTAEEKRLFDALCVVNEILYREDCS